MSVDLIDEQILLLAKQLKIPTFSKYSEIIRQAGTNAPFNRLLLSLMQKEYEQRQENNNRRRLKQVGFPFTKTLEELDISRYDGRISNIFLIENTAMVAALVDRLTYKSYILDMNGDSYRLDYAKRNI